MPAYTQGNNVYFNNSIDAPKEHYNQFILNQEPDFYIASLSKFMNETLTFITKLFVNKMVNKWMNKHIKVVAQLSKVIKQNKENQPMEPMYVAREIGRNILSYVDFSKICNIMKYFPESKTIIGKEHITFTFSSSP